MAGLSVVGEDVLTEDAEMGLVSGDTQHDQIGIQTVHDVSVRVSSQSYNGTACGEMYLFGRRELKLRRQKEMEQKTYLEFGS